MTWRLHQLLSADALVFALVVVAGIALWGWLWVTTQRPRQK